MATDYVINLESVRRKTQLRFFQPGDLLELLLPERLEGERPLAEGRDAQHVAHLASRRSTDSDFPGNYCRQNFGNLKYNHSAFARAAVKIRKIP